jgi:hypothetical protein
MDRMVKESRTGDFLRLPKIRSMLFNARWGRTVSASIDERRAEQQTIYQSDPAGSFCFSITGCADIRDALR